MNYIDMDDIKYKDQLLRKSFLDKTFINQTMDANEVHNLQFLKIKGITNFWEDDAEVDFDNIMADILSGICPSGSTIAFLIKKEKSLLNVYIGIEKSRIEVLEASLHASYPNINITQENTNNISRLVMKTGNYGGIITGIPTKKTFGVGKSFQIERLCKGMNSSEEWAYLILTKPMISQDVAFAHEKILADLEKIYAQIRYTDTGGKFGSESREKVNFIVQRYSDNLTTLETHLDQGRTVGMWSVTSYFIASSEIDADKLGTLLVAIYNGEESKPEKFRAIQITNANHYASSFSLIKNMLPEQHLLKHPLGNWQHVVKGSMRSISFQKYVYQTIVTTTQLTSLIQIPRKEMAGYYIDQFVEFEIAERRIVEESKEFIRIGKVLDGSSTSGSYLDVEEVDIPYQLEFNDLNRHGLIVGITGGGKSNTSKNLLRSLWRKHKTPFMVIESAKREYWELANMKGFDDLLIYTLGSEDNQSIPFRINPFEKMEGVPLQTHIDYLLSTFKASFDLFSPLPYVLETCIYKVYEDRGWDIIRNVNGLGFNSFPTLDDLYYKVDIVVEELGYDSRLQSDITAALKARIHSLRVGGKGAMMNTPKSMPMELLLNRPVVLELEDIGDDEVKAFIMGIILIQLYEYRKSKLSRNKKFEHLILIEEAHRLLANTSPGESGSRAKSVEFFTNLLAEIRSYGQGFLIADQVPTKLAQDTLKNTNLKIVHRLVMQEDRELIGQSMNMSAEQIEYISSLKRGFAAVYAEGDTRPKLVQMPYVQEDYDLSRSQIIEQYRAKNDLLFKEYTTSYTYGPACDFCQKKCDYYDEMQEVEQKLIKEDWLKRFIDECNKNPNYVVFNGYLSILESIFTHINFNHDIQVCLLNILFNNIEFSESKKREFVIDYIKKSLG